MPPAFSRVKEHLLDFIAVAQEHGQWRVAVMLLATVERQGDYVLPRIYAADSAIAEVLIRRAWMRCGFTERTMPEVLQEA